MESGGERKGEGQELKRRLEEVRLRVLLFSRSLAGILHLPLGVSRSPFPLHSIAPSPQLTAAERTARHELLTLESTLQTLTLQLSTLETTSSDLTSQSQSLIHAHALSLSQTSTLEARGAAAGMRYASELAELERLERANVWVDVFCIGSVELGGGGKVGSINGLRLGKGSRSNPVSPLPRPPPIFWLHSFLAEHVRSGRLTQPCGLPFPVSLE